MLLLVSPSTPILLRQTTCLNQTTMMLTEPRRYFPLARTLRVSFNYKALRKHIWYYFGKNLFHRNSFDLVLVCCILLQQGYKDNNLIASNVHNVHIISNMLTFI